MKNVKEEFLKIFKDFGLDFSECENQENRTHFYAKLPGYSGFLIDSYWDSEECIRVATEVDSRKEGMIEYFFFWGNSAYYDINEAREQISKMVLKAKELRMNGKIDNIKTDFNCKV